MISEILLLHHTHTDIGYTHEQPIVWELNRQFIEDALDEIERTAGWDAPSQPIWTCEVTATLRHWLHTASAEQVARFERAVAAGRMSACAMPYNFTPMVGVPQFVRALAWLPELRASLGLKFNVALNHDVNGLPWTMIPLLLDAGVEMVIMGINVHFGAFPLHRPLFFRWVGPDGRSIIALNGEHYGMFQRYARLNEGSLEAMAEGIAGYVHKLEAQAYPHDFAYLTLTHYSFWDNNPPYPAAFELIRRWNAEGRTPRIRFITPDELLARAQAMDLPEHRGDWTDYWNFGAASSAHETRIAYQARARLYAADVLALHARPPHDSRTAALTEQAYDALTLYDEHTWGGYASITDPDRDAMVSGWYHKAHSAHQARALAQYVLTERLDALAGNPRHASSHAGVLIVNPTPFPRREVLPISRAFLEGKYDHLSSTSHRLWEYRELLDQGDAEDAIWIGPFEVPAYGFTAVPSSAIVPLEPMPGLAQAEGALESPDHLLTFDAAGRITSLFDKRTQFELSDPSSPWPMLGLIHETAQSDATTPNKGREVLLELDYARFQEHSFRADWPAARTPEQVRAVRTVRQPHRIGLEIHSDLPTAQAVKRIWLYAHRPEISVEIELRKADVREPDAIYLALPLALLDWEATFDTMGTPTQLDGEQLPGCCRDWVTVSGYADVHTAARGARGLTLACPDAPLVMIGGFNFGRRQLTLDHTRPPLVLGWLVNNYWTTNFRAAQPGRLRFRYELATHAGFDPVEAARVAACARQPLIAHPLIAPPTVSSSRLIEVQGDGVVVAACIPSGTGADVWLQNLTARPQRAQVRLSSGQARAEVTLPPRGIVGARVD